ncbi:MAG: tetratricopeptide repeat protein [Alphaproteobacteria bacterium]
MIDLRKTFGQAGRGVAIAFVALAFLTVSIGTTDAQRNRDEPRSSGGTISVKLQKPVIEIQEILETGNSRAAIAALGRLGSLAEMTPYDQVVINRLYAQAYLEQDNYEQGVKYLERAVAVGRDTMAPAELSQTTFNIGQLYIAIGAEKDGAAAQTFFKKGIDALEGFFRENPNARPESYATLSTAYLQIQPPNYKKGIEWIERAIAKAQELGEQPKEGWYRNLAGLYLEDNQAAKALPIMELLVKNYPKRDYWLQLAYVYGELGKESDQFAALKAAHRQGLLTSSNEQVYLAQLYIQNEIPIRGAEILEKGLDSGLIEKKPENYRLLADAFYTARELDRAIKWYNVAGEQAKGAEPFFFLGQIFMQKEDWEKAAAAWESTIRKNASAPRENKLRMIGNAHYNLGIAYFYQNKCDSAKRAFTNATEFQAQRSSANQWIQRINAGSCGA